MNAAGGGEPVPIGSLASLAHAHESTIGAVRDDSPTPGDDRNLSWELETSHFPAPLTRWAATLYVTEETRVIKELCRDYGLMIDGVEMKEFHGRVYSALVPIGGKARKPPPSFLVPLLCKVVPPLRRRIANARRAEAADAYTEVVERWLGGQEQAMLEEGHELIDRPLDGATEAEVADALEAASDLAVRGTRQHFLLHGTGVDTIGRLGLRLDRAGWSTAEVTELFTGLSDTSTGPARAQAEIVERVRATPAGLDALASARTLDEVAAISAEVATAVTSYLDTWGRRAVRYEVVEATVAERPEWVLGLLQDQAADGGRRPAAGGAADDEQRRRGAAERAEAALGGGADARRLVERAQRAFPIREGNETATVGVPVAALRRIGLVVGARLAASGALERTEDVFDLELAEVIALLRGTAGAPAEPAALARRRREARLAAGRARVPATLGPPAAGPPDLAGFPADIAEGVAATIWYTDKIFGDRTEAPSSPDGGLCGVGVSPGVYEGTARVVLDESGFDRIEAGDVLVCSITSPVWSMVFPSLGALVCDAGGPLSHPAIIAREFGIPAVVGAGTATAVLDDGAQVRVDGRAGTVSVL